MSENTPISCKNLFIIHFLFILSPIGRNCYARMTFSVSNWFLQSYFSDLPEFAISTHASRILLLTSILDWIRLPIFLKILIKIIITHRMKYIYSKTYLLFCYHSTHYKNILVLVALAVSLSKDFTFGITRTPKLSNKIILLQT